MGFFQMMWGGVRLWIILYLIFSLIAGVAVVIYFFKERIKERYYKLRWPEKVIKCLVFHPGGLYKVYWRLIPKGDTFDFDGHAYLYNDLNITKINDIFVKGDDKGLYINIEGKRYDVSGDVKLREKWSGRWPELHYTYGNPAPIDYNKTKSAPVWSSETFAQFKENDLFKKLLTMDSQKSQMMMVIMMLFINIAISGVLLAKSMGWLK